MLLTNGEERIDHSRPFRRFVAPRKEIVFPSQGYGSDRILDKIIINKKVSIV